MENNKWEEDELEKRYLKFYEIAGWSMDLCKDPIDAMQDELMNNLIEKFEDNGE